MVQYHFEARLTLGIFCSAAGNAADRKNILMPGYISRSKRTPL
jgi:hypothetical protein